MRTAEAELDAKPAPLPLTEPSGVARVEEEVLLVVVDGIVFEEEGDGITFLRMPEAAGVVPCTLWCGAFSPSNRATETGLQLLAPING